MSVKPRKGGLFDRLFGRGEKPAEQELESRQEEAAAPTSDEPLQPAEGKQAEAAAEPHSEAKKAQAMIVADASPPRI